ncbi:hypothetical protein GCM10010349_51570 [Streptomyces flavofungini]|nr:hypothetical protein GCM10010349_51570 [Streptomyces flavofungini]
MRVTQVLRGGAGYYGVLRAKGNPARGLRMPDGHPLVTPTPPRPQNAPLLAAAVPGPTRDGARSRRFQAESPVRAAEKHH